MPSQTSAFAASWFPASLDVSFGLEVMAVQAVLVARLVEVPSIMARPVTPTVDEQTTPIHMGSHDGHDETFHEKQINYIISRSELLSSLSLVETLWL